MGAVAREYGFRGWLSSLCDPEINLRYGCKHLKNLERRFLVTYGWEGVVSAYNAGSPRRKGKSLWENQTYVNKIHTAGGFL